MFTLRVVNPTEKFETLFLQQYSALFGTPITADFSDINVDDEGLPTATATAIKTLNFYIRWGYNEDDTYMSRIHKATLMGLNVQLSDLNERMFTIKLADMGTAAARFPEHSPGPVLDSAEADCYNEEGILRDPGSVVSDAVSNLMSSFRGVRAIGLLGELAGQINMLYIALVETLMSNPAAEKDGLKTTAITSIDHSIPTEVLQAARQRAIELANAENIPVSRDFLPNALQTASSYRVGSNDAAPFQFQAYKLVLESAGLSFYAGIKYPTDTETGIEQNTAMENNNALPPNIDVFREELSLLIAQDAPVYYYDTSAQELHLQGNSLGNFTSMYQNTTLSSTVESVFYNPNRSTPGPMWGEGGTKARDTRYEYGEKPTYYNYASWLQEVEPNPELDLPDGNGLNFDFEHKQGIPLAYCGTNLMAKNAIFLRQINSSYYPEWTYHIPSEEIDRVTGGDSPAWLVPLDKQRNAQWFAWISPVSRTKGGSENMRDAVEKILTKLAGGKGIGDIPSYYSQRDRVLRGMEEKIGKQFAWASIFKTQRQSTYDVIEKFVDNAKSMQLILDITSPMLLDMQQFDYASLSPEEKQAFKTSITQTMEGTWKPNRDRKYKLLMNQQLKELDDGIVDRVFLLGAKNTIETVFTKMRDAIEEGIDPNAGYGTRNIQSFPQLNSRDASRNAMILGVGTQDTIVTRFSLDEDILLPVQSRARTFNNIKKLSDFVSDDGTRTTMKTWMTALRVEAEAMEVGVGMREGGGLVTVNKADPGTTPPGFEFVQEFRDIVGWGDVDIPMETFLTDSASFIARLAEEQEDNIVARSFQTRPVLKRFQEILMSADVQSMFFDVQYRDTQKYMYINGDGHLRAKEKNRNAVFTFKDEAISQLLGATANKYERVKTLVDRRFGEYVVMAKVETLGIPEISSDYYDIRFRPIDLQVLNPRSLVPGSNQESPFVRHWSSGIYNIWGYTHTINPGTGYKTSFTLQRDPFSNPNPTARF